MADITYDVAMPFFEDDNGSPVAGDREQCQSPITALRRAEILSRGAGHVGGVAFSRSGDPDRRVQRGDTAQELRQCAGDLSGL